MQYQCSRYFCPIVVTYVVRLFHTTSDLRPSWEMPVRVIKKHFLFLDVMRDRLEPTSPTSTSNQYIQRQPITGQTALGRLNEEVEMIPIVTFCQSLDEMLGGGIQSGLMCVSFLTGRSNHRILWRSWHWKSK
jgi:hypothetical protein